MSHTHRPTSPAPPHAWLAVHQFRDGRNLVHGIFESPDDSELHSLVTDLPKWGAALLIAPDDPSLKVNQCGLWVRNAASLSARDIWFQRFESVLSSHLHEPRIAQVFTFRNGQLSDPLCTHKTSARGPFPFPEAREWPTCGYCHHPMAFMGVLDFRQVQDVRLPGDALVFHACHAECGPCADEETVSLVWVSHSEPIRIYGDDSPYEVSIGTAWHVTEYPTPAYRPEDLSNDAFFLAERQIYVNFTCFADKIGGHIFWIQDEEVPVDRNGQPMAYIGQFVGSKDVDIGDSGIAYIFFSESSGETRHVIQCF